MTLARTSPPEPPTDRAAACTFCAPGLREETVLERGTVFAVLDGFPVTAGHTLVPPRRHTPDLFAMTAAERRDTLASHDVLRERLLAGDVTITGCNVAMNCGETAGQTVPHAHTHLIPRREGDTPSPRGDVRGAVPARMSY